jgi:hypothetical protein
VLQVLLRQHGVVLLHHVKPRLMERIARLTGAQILPSIDSVMNRFNRTSSATCIIFFVAETALYSVVAPASNSCMQCFYTNAAPQLIY